jgi:hypothetical protein
MTPVLTRLSRIASHLSVILSVLGAAFFFEACSRYALNLDDTGHEKPVVVRVDENSISVASKLRAYLLSRGRLDSGDLAPLRDGSLNFVQPWIRDTSLRYYSLNFDTREREMSDWKAQWHLKPLGAHQSELSLVVLELIFVGPAKDAGPRPEAGPSARANLLGSGRYPAAAFDNSDWYETDPDNLRAALEMRRFWIETYPLKALPKVLASITVPLLQGPPLSTKAAQKRHWEPLHKQTSF